jgi:hypothetical protein
MPLYIRRGNISVDSHVGRVGSKGGGTSSPLRTKHVVPRVTQAKHLGMHSCSRLDSASRWWGSRVVQLEFLAMVLPVIEPMAWRVYAVPQVARTHGSGGSTGLCAVLCALCVRNLGCAQPWM